MRPIQRGLSPQSADFHDYRDAYPYLQSRLGAYCSYCERYIATNLAVEHIQPKALPQYAALIGRWDNFLLGCVNCNSTKKDKEVVLSEFYLPDRDNTFAVFEYTPDGRMEPAAHLNPAQQKIAQDTLALMGLDKPASNVQDENGKLVAIDRVSQRMEVILTARRSLKRLQQQRTAAFQEQIVETALKTGFFSIWMTVFAQDSEMRCRFIEGFPNTARDCFDQQTQPVSPRPDNGLLHAGKV